MTETTPENPTAGARQVPFPTLRPRKGRGRTSDRKRTGWVSRWVSGWRQVNRLV
jgi:hypothetical protein